MFGLHGCQVVVGSGNEVVASGGEFKDGNVGFRSQGEGLVQKLLGVG